MGSVTPLVRVARMLVVCVLVVLLVGSGVAAASGQQSVLEERPTDDATQRLTVNVDRKSTTGTVRVFVACPARTADEATAAKNESLEPSWFRPEDRVRKIFDARADGDDELPKGSFSVHHEQSLSGRTPSNPDHGWILLQYETAWYGYVDPGENLTIDRTYANALEEGWELQLITPRSWEPATVHGDPVVEPSGQTGTSYAWQVMDDTPDVLLAFDQPMTATETTDGIPLGNSGGAVVALSALSVAVLVLIRRQEVHE